MYRLGLRLLAKSVGPANVRVIEARIRYGRRIDLTNPETLADKVSWLEFNTDQTRAAELSDKIAVRDFVASKGLTQILIPTIGKSWSNANDIDLSLMPKKFVMKAAHGSGMNHVCENFSTSDSKKLESLARSWLRQDYPRAAIEPHYLPIPRRVYCETYLDDSAGLVDYKVHCINGEPRFMLATSERGNGLKRGLYNLDWEPIPGLKASIEKNGMLPRPQNFEEMITIARKLSEDLPFARVDLYNVDGRVYFGELTFSPAGGTFGSFTDELIAKYGSEMVID